MKTCEHFGCNNPAEFAVDDQNGDEEPALLFLCAHHLGDTLVSIPNGHGAWRVTKLMTPEPFIKIPELHVALPEDLTRAAFYLKFAEGVTVMTHHLIPDNEMFVFGLDERGSVVGLKVSFACDHQNSGGK